MSEVITNGFKDYSKNFEEVEVSVPWGKICGKWWGPQNVKPIIGLHGWQDNSGTFDKLAPSLVAKGLSFYCIDFPGHGFSSPIPKGLEYYLWWDGVHFLRRIVKHYSWNKITIIGHSLGGGIAFLYATFFPDDVSKYVSIDIASPSVRNIEKMISFAGPSIDKLFEYETYSLDKMPCYEYDEMVDIMLDAHNGSVDKEGCEILLKRGMKLASHKKDCYLFTRDPRLKIASLGFISIEQVLQFASKIKCEVLNIRANQSLKIDHPEYYDMTLDAIEKNAKRVVREKVEGTHHVHLTNADLVAPIIIKFLLE